LASREESLRSQLLGTAAIGLEVTSIASFAWMHMIGPLVAAFIVLALLFAVALAPSVLDEVQRRRNRRMLGLGHVPPSPLQGPIYVRSHFDGVLVRGSPGRGLLRARSFTHGDSLHLECGHVIDLSSFAPEARDQVESSERVCCPECTS
jgi:hypothetical protein